MTDTATAEIPAQAPPLADTTDMAQVHRVFRDAIAAAPSLINTTPRHEPARRDLVAAYIRNVLALLHAHHDGEDELIWPILIERAPDQAEDVQRIAAQHDDVDSALKAASAAIETWQQTATKSRPVLPRPRSPRSARHFCRISTRRKLSSSR